MKRDVAVKQDARVKQDEERRELFTKMPVGRAVIALAVPSVISQIITVIYNMADTFFVGQMGDPNQVAAATLSMPLFLFMTGIANIFGMGGASLISRCLGMGNREKAKNCSAFCIWGALGTALLYGILVLLLEPVLLPLLGVNHGTREYASQYIFWAVGVGAVPTVLNPELANLIRAEGYSKQASMGVAFGGILNIFLDPLFIFGLKMEIAGAAIATLLSNLAATLYFFGFLYKIRANSTITALPRYFTWKQHIPSEVLEVGLPSFMISAMATISTFSVNKITSSYMNEAVAGMGIAKKIDTLAFAIAQGMGQGTMPLIGYNFTSGNRKRMLSAVKVLLADSLIIALAGTALLFVAAGPVTGCFIDDAQTVEYGRRFLRIICLACPTTAVNFFAITVFQATGKKVQPIFLSLLRKGTLDVALMILLNQFFGITGIAWATPAADAAALILSAILLVPYLKKLGGAKAALPCRNGNF